jgi:alcohol dehydrogenase class IV
MMTVSPVGFLTMKGECSMATDRVLRFRQPAFVQYGFGVSALTGEGARQLGMTRVLIVTDRGVRDAGLADGIVASLDAAGVPYEIFDEVEPNPTTVIVERALSCLLAMDADGVVALGGGSSMDTGKAVAFLATNGGKVADYMARDSVKLSPLPCIAIPTTAGTSSEVTNNVVFTDPETHYKFGIASPNAAAAKALIDPELTLTMPPPLTAATGMDALTHALESYISKGAYDLTEALALEAIRLIGRWLPAAVKDGQSRQPRERMMMACLLGGIAFNQSRLVIVHPMSHPVSGWCGTPHGVANAILLPHVMAFNVEHAAEKLARVAGALGIDTGGLSTAGAAGAAVDKVRSMNEELGIPPSLSAVGVRPELIPPMATDAIKSGNIPLNPRPTTYEDIVAIYEGAM